MKNVNQNYCTKKYKQTNSVYHILSFTLNWLFANCFNSCKQHMSAIKSWNWQQVEYGKICRYKRNKKKQIGCTLLCIGRNGRNSCDWPSN